MQRELLQNEWGRIKTKRTIQTHLLLHHSRLAWQELLLASPYSRVITIYTGKNI